MNRISLLISMVAILTICSCSPGDSGKKPEGVLTNAQEKTLEKAKGIDDTAKTIEDKRLKELNEAEGEKTEPEK
jgi:hypothetical protein